MRVHIHTNTLSQLCDAVCQPEAPGAAAADGSSSTVFEKPAANSGGQRRIVRFVTILRLLEALSKHWQRTGGGLMN